MSNSNLPPDRSVQTDEVAEAQSPTFSEAAAIVCDQLASHSSNPQYPGHWYRLLEPHVLPHVGTRQVSDLEPKDVLDVLE